MFKWPEVPTVDSNANELMDFAEMAAWRNRSMARTELAKLIGRLDENDYADGVPEEDEYDRIIDEAYLEAEQRLDACRNGYPFEVAGSGHTLRVSTKGLQSKQIIYKYLLLATRLNMKDNRTHAQIDGTLLLEQLAAEVAQGYLGPRAGCLVFGTSSKDKNFAEKIDTLCRKLEEGGGFENRDPAAPTARDGKLDVVAWKHFADGQPGKLIAFGQCKTGTSYHDTLTQLQPSVFCDKWLRSAPVVPPVRMFFVAEALSRSHWSSMARDAGILFDRCRIVDFADEISTEVLEKVRAWTRAAAEKESLVP